MMKKSNKKGFTLVELIVVIAIMAILAAVLIPTVTNKINDAKKATAKQDCTATASALASALIDKIANNTDIPADLRADGADVPATFVEGTKIYGSETAGFVVVTKVKDTVFFAQVTKDGAAKPLQEVTATVTPSLPTA